MFLLDFRLLLFILLLVLCVVFYFLFLLPHILYNLRQSVLLAVLSSACAGEIITRFFEIREYLFFEQQWQQKMCKAFVVGLLFVKNTLHAV